MEHPLSVLAAATALAAAAALGMVGAASAPAPQPDSAPGEGKSVPAQAGDDDHRPIVRLRVRNLFKPEDTLFPQIMEGRLITDLADMETFRTVGFDSKGDDLLTLSIRHLDLATGQVYRSTRDAESGSTPTSEDRLTVSMDLEIRLEDASGKEIYTGKLTAQGSQVIEISLDHTLGLARQEMIDRAAQKLERLIRKRLKSS